MTVCGLYTVKDLNRAAKAAATRAAQERGFKRGAVAFWAIGPIPGGMSLTVQVTATNPDGNFAQFPTTEAI